VLMTPPLFHPNFGVFRSPMLDSLWACTLSYSAMKLFSKYSNLCENIRQTDRRTDRGTDDLLWHKGHKPLHQFPRSKSVTSWRGQKSVVSVVSCRFPNSITTTCCHLVADLLVRQQVRNKLATSYGETFVMYFGHNRALQCIFNIYVAQ